MIYIPGNTPKAKLEKARLMTSDCSCTLSFICCGELYEVIEDDMQPVSLSLEQVSGIFLALESVANRAREIKELVIDASPLANKTRDACQWIDGFLSVISLALKLARINFADDDHSGDYISVDRLWLAGFFSTLKHTDDQTGEIFEAICDICEALPEASKGGELAENT